MPTVIANYCEQLVQSFAAMYAALEVPRIAMRVVAVMVSIHTGLLAYSAYVHSPTINEPAHLAAGLSYWKFGRFDVYNVNPPLVRLVAAFPVMAVGYQSNWSGFSESPTSRPEIVMGDNFVIANGDRAALLFIIARCACIPFSWIGAIACYLWGRDLYGRPAGIVACALWCFEPNILAHASLLTTDAHATSLGIMAYYVFWRWLVHPTWILSAWVGTHFGLAMLAKSTFLLFAVSSLPVWIFWRLIEGKSIIGRSWWREAFMFVVVVTVTIYVLNIGYVFEGTGRQLGEFVFTSRLFGDLQDHIPLHDDLLQGTAASHRDGSVMAWIRLPLPSNFIEGIDTQQRDSEGRRPSYLRGQWKRGGWWYYYFYAMAIKLPLAIWLLFIVVIFGRTMNCLSKSFWMTQSWTCSISSRCRHDAILLCPVGLVLLVVSAKTGLNGHLRYALPAFPFIFIWVSQSIRKVLDVRSMKAITFNTLLLFQRRTPVGFPIVILLVVWLALSSLWIYPHSLTYFNEIIGGPRNGWKHLLGSDFDWGQDLDYVRSAKIQSDEKIISLSQLKTLAATKSAWNGENIDRDITYCYKVVLAGLLNQ